LCFVVGRMGSHTAGVCVTGTQCGEKLAFATKSSFVVGGSAILSTGDYRAFRVRDPHCWRMRHESQCGESLIRLSSHCWEYVLYVAVWR